MGKSIALQPNHAYTKNGLINRIIESFIDYVLRPKIEVYYDSGETYHKAKDYTFHFVLGNYAHVMVHNFGLSTAKNCTAFLKKIEMKDYDGRWKKVSDFRKPMVLKWAHEEDFYPRNIEHGTSRRLDLCYVHEGFDVVHFYTGKHDYEWQTSFPAGEYRVTIEIISENAKPAKNKFIVKYTDGQFDSLKISEY